MSWNTESDDQRSFRLGADEKCTEQIKKITDLLTKVEKLISSNRQNLELFKAERIKLKALEDSRGNLQSSLVEIQKEIDILHSMKLDYNSQTLQNLKNEINKIRDRAKFLTSRATEISQEISVELKNREMKRKKEISIVSNVIDFDEESQSHFAQMTIDDVQLQEALEEQRQMNKLYQDLVKLEDLFLMPNTNEEVEQRDFSIICTVPETYVRECEDEEEVIYPLPYKRSAMKKKLCIIGIVLAVLLVLALIIGLSVGLSKK